MPEKRVFKNPVVTPPPLNMKKIQDKESAHGGSQIEISSRSSTKLSYTAHNFSRPNSIIKKEKSPRDY
jgi:hypothetical protein